MIASVVPVPWHTIHGGYHRLLDYLPAVHRITAPCGHGTTGIALRGAHRVFRRRCPLPFYPAPHFATDLALLRRPGAAHVLYGDEQYWYSRRREGPTVVTYHQPPSRLAELLPLTVWRDIGTRTSAIMVLDPHQREFFTRFVPPDRVHLVPHGIDTTAFSPGGDPTDSSRPLVLTVGWWLRDWGLLHAVHDRLHRRHGKAVELAVVTRKADRVQWHPAARVLQGITEDALITLYRRASVVLLPLSDATANNALLEALACGTPVVASDVGGTRFYTGDSPAALLVPPGDPSATADAVEEVLAECGTQAYTLRSGFARKRAEAMAWPLVAEQVRAVYRLLEDG